MERTHSNVYLKVAVNDKFHGDIDNLGDGIITESNLPIAQVKTSTEALAIIRNHARSRLQFDAPAGSTTRGLYKVWARRLGLATDEYDVVASIHVLVLR